MKPAKRPVTFFLILALIVALTVLPASAVIDPEKPLAQPGANSKQVLVKFKKGISEPSKHRINLKHGFEAVDEIPQLGIQVVRATKGTAKDKLREYQSESSVEYVELDHEIEAFETPNDTYFSRQWGMVKVSAPSAWDDSKGSATVKIAVLDTGVDQNHPDLAAKIVANKNFTSARSVDDLYGHGTHVAGIAAAITGNKSGVAGGSYSCALMNGKVLNDSGSGYTSWVASGIIWAADNGAKVINLSLGSAYPSTTLESAINYAWSKGAVIVAAAGNSGSSSQEYPAAYVNCIAVAATDQNDNKASFSTFGSWVDVAAPGVGIFSTVPNHKYKLRSSIGAYNYGSMSGTSMAAPHVAGLAGLVWTTPYGTSNVNVRDRIESTADTNTAGNTYSYYGLERINYDRAVSP